MQCFLFALICAFWKLIKTAFFSFLCKLWKGDPRISAISLSVGLQKIWFLIPAAIPTVTEYSFFSKICLLNKAWSCSRCICYTYKNYCFLYCWIGYGLKIKLVVLALCPQLARIVLYASCALCNWQPCMGRAEGLFGQDCCRSTMKSEQHRITKPPGLQWEWWECASGCPSSRDVSNDRAPPSIFCFTSLFLVWPSPSHCRGVVWPCSVFSVSTGPNSLTICNASGILVLCSI